MSDTEQYDDGGSGFDADLEGEEYGGDPDLGAEAEAEAFAGHDPAALEQAAAEMLADFPELEQAEVAQALAEHSRLAAEELGMPHLAENLDFWRAIHVARGGGADAGGAGQGDEFDQVIALATGGRNALPFA